MILDPVTILILVVGAALIFDFVNGWNDSANAIATVVSTRVLSPLAALALASALNFAGAYLGTHVAKTIGTGLVDPHAVTQGVVLASMLAAAVWVMLMTWLGLPISGSHSLIGALLGAAWAFEGTHLWHGAGIWKVLIALFVSPLLGLLAGFFIMVALLWLFRSHTPSLVNRVFGKLQIVSASFMALAHGTNDAQKVMGVITLALVAAKRQDHFEVPFWVVTACAMVMALGTAIGGWKVIKTLGVGLTNLKPVHGFAAETGASIVLFSAARLGVPVSTTHCITASIMGVGAIRGWAAVRWGMGRKIVFAWFFTFPAAGGLAALFYWGIRHVVP